jgi:hypothetical protein
MNLKEFKAKVLTLGLQQVILLNESTCLEDIKIEPEQIRKNIAATQSILHDTVDYLKELSEKHSCSSSGNSISE